MNSKDLVGKILEPADIVVNGDRPWDIQVHNEKLYDRVLAKGTLGIGESYMDGWWDCGEIDELVNRMIRVGGDKVVARSFSNALRVIKAKLINLQTESGSKKVAREHYDLGNDMYMAFLDPYNQYTCGYFKDTEDLDVAQEQKLDLICRKLKLKSTDKVLDIGCGWGGFAKYAAEHFGCHVTGISISDEQIAYAKEFTKGLSVEIINADYREIKGKYDKVLICGMIEHVGYKNYRKIMEIIKKVLVPDGIFLLHTIGRNDSKSIGFDAWIEKYIFPNSMVPSSQQIAKASEGLFVMEDLHNFGLYYDKTLLAWWKNFDASWSKFKDKYGERFYRMFRYYILSCAGTFRGRKTLLWQMVFTHIEKKTQYESVR
ncbi:MAG TPA: cyclopropane fatty acyl phospholipid synthase [Candidatus Paceibacterota bacterium]